MAGGTVRSVCEEIGLPIKFDEDDIAQRAVNENLEGLHQRTLSLTQSVARSMARKLNREWSKEETNEEDFARVWQSAGERHSTCALTPHAFIGVWLRNPRERRAIDV
jgi:hypothetical protein